MDWAEKVVVPYMRDRRANWGRENGLPIEEAPHGLMIQDNLSSQCREEFVDYIEKEASTVVHFGEKSSSTHMWAAIDRGIGKLIKDLMADEITTWCSATRENWDEWASQKMSCSRRRILMTKFVGQAWRSYKSKYQASHTKICKRAGMLVTLDGYGDGDIKLEGCPFWTPTPRIELDDELREYYKAECAKHITPACVDLDLFTCTCVVRDVDKKSCHYS